MPKPIEPVDFAPHAESIGFGAPFIDQFGGMCAVVGSIAIQQHGRMGSPRADQVRARADAYIHFHGTVEVLLGFSPAIETCRKLATGESQRAIADETHPAHPDLIGNRLQLRIIERGQILIAQIIAYLGKTDDSRSPRPIQRNFEIARGELVNLRTRFIELVRFAVEACEHNAPDRQV